MRDSLDASGRTVDLAHHNINLQYSQEELIDATFGTVINRHTLMHLHKTVILAPTNRTTLELNNIVPNKMPNDLVYRFSIDSPQDSDESDMFSPELLHEMHPPGMPPHMLHLKEGAIYMLLRNMNIKLDLCNGSRYVLLDCSNPFVLKCQLIPAGPQELIRNQPYFTFLASTPRQQTSIRFSSRESSSLFSPPLQ